MAKGIVQNVRKKAKKAIAAILSVTMLFTMVGGVEIVRGEEADFCMTKGASVRINANTGIRFAVEISGSTKEILFDSNNLRENVEVGMIVVPSDILDSVSDTTGDTNYFEKIQEKYGKTKEQIATKFSNSQFRTENGKTVATAAIVNIKDVNYAKTYQAVAYYTLDNGKTYVYTNKSDKRTIGFVADKALSDTKDYTGDLAKTVGSLLDKYIRVNNDNDMSCELLNGEKLDLFSTYAKGLDNSNQFKFSVKNKADNVKIDGTEIKAEKEGRATVAMEGYDGLIDLEIPVTTGESYKASFTGTKVYYSGDSDVTGEIYTREQLDSYEGSIPLTIGGREAQLKATFNFTNENWNDGSVITLYSQMNMTKSRVKELMDAGYDKLVVPYYLYTDSKEQVSITGFNYISLGTAKKGEWSEVSYELEYVYENYESLNDAVGEKFFLRLEPKSAGTYELYIGDCEVTTKKEIPAPEITDADRVIALIDALPEADSIILDNKDAVTEAKNAYDALSPEEQKEVINLEKLNECVAKIEKLEASKKVTVEYSSTSPHRFDYYKNTEYNAYSTAELINETYEGTIAKWHGKVNVQKQDGDYLRAYQGFDLTLEQLKSYANQGYTHIRIPYYLTVPDEAKDVGIYVQSNNEEWEYKLGKMAELNRWSYYDFSVNDLLSEVKGTNGKTLLECINIASGSYGLLNVWVNATGTYELYLGECEMIQSEDIEIAYTGTVQAFDIWQDNGYGDWQGAHTTSEQFNGQIALWKSNEMTLLEKMCEKEFISNDGYIRAFTSLGVTKDELVQYKEHGYSYLRIPYYLVAPSGSKQIVNINNDSSNQWSYDSCGEMKNNQWSYLDYPIDNLIASIEGINNGVRQGYGLLNIQTDSLGKYQLYLGQAKLIGSASPTTADNSKSRSVARATSNTEWSMFKSLKSVYSGVKGEKTLGVEKYNKEQEGIVASYRTGGTIEDKYAKDGSIKLYTPLAVRKPDIKNWIDAGYDKLKVQYFVESDNNYGVHVYAMDKKQYSKPVKPGAWNVAYLDLEYIYKNYDRICDAAGDNYLLRVELKQAGTYAIYLGDCKPMADTYVELNNGKCLGYNATTYITYNGTVEYEVSVSDYVKENMMVDNQTAYWSTKINIPSTSWDTTNTNNDIQIRMKPNFSLDDVKAWKSKGYDKISIPYYIKGVEGSGYVFVRGCGDWYEGAAKANMWSTIDIPLSYVETYYDGFNNTVWCFALRLPGYGEYEIYFGEGEVIAGSANEQETIKSILNAHNVYWEDGTGKYASGKTELNTEIYGRIAEISTKITIPEGGIVGSEKPITFYYTLNVSKKQIEDWISAGYTDLKIPYYLEGSASQIWGQKSHSTWADYIRVDAKTNEWSEFSIRLTDILDRYEYIQMGSGENYLFRITPTATGTLSMAIGQCGVYKQATEETKAVATYTDKAVATTKNIVTNSNANYDILIPKNAGSYVKTAAEELQTFIKESTGAKLNIVTKATGNYISVGNTKELSHAGLSVAKAVKGTEGYQINTVGDNVYIYADKDLGVVYGVYGYLERTLHYDYFYKDVFKIDQNNTASLYELDVTDVPDFATRVASYSVTDEKGWLFNSKERLRVRMETYTENMTGALGLNDDNVEVAYAFHNSLNYLPEAEYGTSNPSWYHKVDNKVKQLCYNAGGDVVSREKMEDIVAGKMFETLTTAKYKNYDKIVFAAVEDNTEWCSCEACKADLASYGAKSASVVRFCNNVADKVENLLRAAKDSRAETFKLVFYAYNAVEDAPILTSTDANGNVSYSYRPEMKLNYHVTPLYAPIEADFSKSFKAETNKTYYERLKKWNMIANEVYMEAYDSFFNNRGYLLPYNSWDSLSDLYKTAYENGVTWMYNLGQENNSASSGFSLLKAYLESKLSWDVNANVNDLTDKFFEAMYGEEADTVKGVYNSIKTHMNALTAENFWPQVNSSNRNKDGHFNVLKKSWGTIDNDNPEVENWNKTQLVNWYNTLSSAEKNLESSNPMAAKFVRLEEMNVLSILFETQYIKYDNTHVTGGSVTNPNRSYRTSNSGFKDYRTQFEKIVTEWDIKNAAENDWTMADYLIGLNN